MFVGSLDCRFDGEASQLVSQLLCFYSRAVYLVCRFLYTDDAQTKEPTDNQPALSRSCGPAATGGGSCGDDAA